MNVAKTVTGTDRMKFLSTVLAVVITTAVFTGSATAAPCGNTAAGFKPWLSDFKKQMKTRGFSARTISASLNGLTYDANVIRLDRGQKSFKQSFARFYKRRTKGMVRIGRQKMKQNARLLSRIEKKYGVPPELLTAVWGLETAFGRFMGKQSIMKSLATLSYDCRRSDFFTKELVAALTIVQRGDLTPAQMRGAWAGEIGQTQFLPTRFVKYAISFDGNRRRDLYRSVPDVLASTAAWFQGNGWQRGKGWQPGSTNWKIIGKWNHATVYQKTIAKLATELRRKK